MTIKKKIEMKLREMKSQNPGCSPNAVYLGMDEYMELKDASHWQSDIKMFNEDTETEYMKVYEMSVFVVSRSVYPGGEKNHFFIPVNQYTMETV